MLGESVFVRKDAHGAYVQCVACSHNPDGYFASISYEQLLDSTHCHVPDMQGGWDVRLPKFTHRDAIHFCCGVKPLFFSQSHDRRALARSGVCGAR